DIVFDIKADIKVVALVDVTIFADVFCVENKFAYIEDDYPKFTHLVMFLFRIDKAQLAIFL
uniref:Uncharacterized protein n=1 Tax=Romanomermis culicivorax TaxID=13658 RepID=A0A915L9R2_ROMCU